MSSLKLLSNILTWHQSSSSLSSHITGLPLRGNVSSLSSPSPSRWSPIIEPIMKIPWIRAPDELFTQRSCERTLIEAFSHPNVLIVLILPDKAEPPVAEAAASTVEALRSPDNGRGEWDPRLPGGLQEGARSCQEAAQGAYFLILILVSILILILTTLITR